MAYWSQVARRAWREAAKTVKLDSRKLLMVLVLGQIVVGTILYLALGPDKLPDNVIGRCATIAAPILLFVPLFFWELILTPAKMHAEQLVELDRARAEAENALSTSAAKVGPRDSIILDLQEENAALKTDLSEIKKNTDAEYPFSAAQRAALVRFLGQISSETRSEIVIFHAGFMGGSSDYARRMARAFREAGWEVQAYPDYLIQPTNEGICLATPPGEVDQPKPLPPLGRIVHEALEAAGIEHKLALRRPESENDTTERRFYVFSPSV